MAHQNRLRGTVGGHGLLCSETALQLPALHCAKVDRGAGGLASKGPERRRAGAQTDRQCHQVGGEFISLLLLLLLLLSYLVLNCIWEMYFLCMGFNEVVFFLSSDWAPSFSGDFAKFLLGIK